MELIEERGANPNREGDNPHNGNTSNNSITVAKLLNGIKKTNSNEDISRFYREDIEVLATNPNPIKSATDNIATYPNKVERGHVFTDNNYYLCTNIDQEGNFTIVAQLPIEGNEELIRDIRQGLSMDTVIPIHGTESITPFITQVKRRGGRTYRNISSSQRQTRVDGRNDNIHLGQQPHTESNQQPLDRDDDTIIPTTSFRSIPTSHSHGTSGLAAVVVTKNNESPTSNGKAYELGQPISNH